MAAHVLQHPGRRGRSEAPYPVSYRNTQVVLASDIFIIQVDYEPTGLPLYQDLLEE